MCMMVWVATSRSHTTLDEHHERDAASGYRYIEEAAADHPVRARFTLPCVYYVGAHTGCGCGYSSDAYVLQFREVADVFPLLDVLTDDERAEFLAEQTSRQRLRDLLEALLVEGPVEVYACWAGEEADPVLTVVEVTPAHFTAHVQPLEERTRYDLRGGSGCC